MPEAAKQRVSSVGRRACLKREMRWCCDREVNARAKRNAAVGVRQRQDRRSGRHARVGRLHGRADCTKVSGQACLVLRRVGSGLRRSRRRLDDPLQNKRCWRRSLAAFEMHVPERQRELDRQREKGEPRCRPKARPQPTHCLTRSHPHSTRHCRLSRQS